MRALTISVILTLLLISCSTPQQTPSQTFPQAILNGIENGECVAPKINLWDGPQQRRVITTAEGCANLPVEILATDTTGQRTMYHVRTIGSNAGKEGWVSESLILK